MEKVQGFNKLYRLLSKRDFLYLKDGSRRLKSPCMAFYYKKSRVGEEFSRIGFSVSKKVGPSVVRNRIKRILRECFRKSAFKECGVDMLIVIYPGKETLFDSWGEYEKALLGDTNHFLKKIQMEQRC